MRYLPLTSDDRAGMLSKIGVDHIDALFADIPSNKLLKHLPKLPLHKGELEVERLMGRMSARSVAASSVPFLLVPVRISITFLRPWII